MEYVVFLIGLALFVAYPYLSVLAVACLSFAAVAALMPRVEFIDVLGSYGVVQVAYLLTMGLLIHGGLAGFRQRLRAPRGGA